MLRPELLLVVACCLPAAPATAHAGQDTPPPSVQPALPAIFDSVATPDTGAGVDSAAIAATVTPDSVAAADTAPVPVVTATNGAAATGVESCPWGPHKPLAQGVAAVTFAGANLELFRRFKNAWWSGEKSDGFFFRADWDEPFRDQDKFGHLFGGYHLTRGGHTLLRGACVSEKRAIMYSAIYATLFQLQIEIWDGYYEKYGFSYPDLLANTLGMGLAVLHAVKPETEIVKPTISYRRSAAMKERREGDEIRASIDYSGQTYWFSLDVESALPESARPYWPGILRFSVGHSITDWILPRPPGAPENAPQDLVRAKRRILLSLDIEAERLPGNHPLWKFVKRQLGFIRFPAPALQVTPSVKLIPWYR
ncbi:MAG TPA: DUF2279 domain-containing protein [Gemmatimonadaceae bacterium]|nr:DUF2279 domain-containing protein [Gemmatimonadaceae bacterium]